MDGMSTENPGEFVIRRAVASDWTALAEIDPTAAAGSADRPSASSTAWTRPIPRSCSSVTDASADHPVESISYKEVER
jgi:hypothetical protein